MPLPSLPARTITADYSDWVLNHLVSVPSRRTRHRAGFGRGPWGGLVRLGLHSYVTAKWKISVSWHCARLREELAERCAAVTSISQLSEKADVVFTISRARFDGHPFQSHMLIAVPASVLLYMVAKFSLRWTFIVSWHLCAVRGAFA
ncbi:hypothetical protein PspLS_11904 [Pyricularia sp. CBS 133598]|nr:hypothetical protein PspLS_11904 [Pyricularia sp. CBS 133598]